METESLPADVRDYIRKLESTVDTLANRDETWKDQYTRLEQRYKLLLFKRFGRSTEKTDKKQLSFFDEAETTEDSPPDAPEVSEVEEKQGGTSKKRGRKPIDASLPREETLIDIPEEDKLCACGHELLRIGEEASERIHVIPEQMWVERVIRPKYACRNCEGFGDEEKAAVRIAPVPTNLIQKSIATPSLLAFLLINKYSDHLPFYRQEARFERIGIRLSRQNMSRWQQMAFSALEPLFDQMKAHLKTGKVLQMDETTVQVMKEDGRDDSKKSYMWLARGGPPEKKVVWYEYQPTRKSDHIHGFLDDFSGYLQTDGYKAYETAMADHERIVHVGCWAHARRKFFEAAKVMKKNSTGAEQGMKYIQKLYAIEKSLRKNADPSAEVFLAKRKNEAEPVLDEFRTWLETQEREVLPSSSLGEAVSYTLRQWSKLIRYVESAELTPDNNAAERAVRPFVLGRKNWLFSGSPEGAKSSCGMYSLIQTAKENGLNPHGYLMHLFEKAPLAETPEDWTALLPFKI